MPCVSCSGNGMFTEENCPAVAYQWAGVCATVTVVPRAEAGEPSVLCCGAPAVTANACCSGRKNGACSFNVVQEICVTVPVTFSAEAAITGTFIQCGEASAGEICTGCGGDGAAAI